MSYYSPLVAVLTTLLLTAVILFSKFGKQVQDIPNERSLHSSPIPRVGGIGLMAGLSAGWMLMFAAPPWWLMLPLFILFIISLLDDVHGLPVRLRLPAHLAAAAVLIWGSGLFSSTGVLIAVIMLLLTVWMTNLYNFMDGSNGLAGGMAIFGFAMYGAAALMNYDTAFAMQNISISAAAIGFLFYNFPKARVFMGDAGSIPLGFLAAAMGLWGWQHGNWPAWFPLLVFSPFIVDASVTLLRRSLRGVRITEAHREHYYQRLVQMGWSHRSVALAEYVLMLACGVTALVLRDQQLPLLALLAWGIVYIALMLSIDAAWKKFERRQNA